MGEKKLFKSLASGQQGVSHQAVVIGFICAHLSENKAEAVQVARFRIQNEPLLVNKLVE